MITVKYSEMISDRPPRRVLASISEAGIQKALISFRGTVQRHFYEVIKRDMGTEPLACFRSMGDALAFAQTEV